MGTFKGFCKNGHLMAETRVTLVSGVRFCGVCKTAYNKKYSIEQAQEKSIKDRIYRLSRNYGMTEQSYDEMVANQNGLCKICYNPLSARQSPHIDHDHKTGKVRGILCISCNTGLGMLKDNPDYLTRAIDYLKDSNMETEND